MAERPAPVVVKVGGGLAREGGPDALRRCATALAGAAARQPLLVVPGGGPFADAVREADARYRLGDRAAHEMALLAMDQFGHLLAHLLADATITTAVAAGPGLRVLLPARAVSAAGPQLPPSWEVTSDSIAAWVARQVGAPRLLLVKPVAGLLRDGPDGTDLVAELDADALEALQRGGGGGVVDRRFAGLLRSLRCPAWLVDGRRPERVAALAGGGEAPATRLVARQA